METYTEICIYFSSALCAVHIQLVGLSGNKRRRINQSLKERVGGSALQDGRAPNPSAMAIAVNPALVGSSWVFSVDPCWKTKAACEAMCRPLHAIGLNFDGVRIGKPAKELLSIYLWTGRHMKCAMLPPAATPSKGKNTLKYTNSNIRPRSSTRSNTQEQYQNAIVQPREGTEFLHSGTKKGTNQGT